MDKKVYEFIYKQTGEKILEWKRCSCGEEFPITDKDLEFYEKVSPVFDWKKYQIPTPTLCPDCRNQRRLSWRNERKLYRSKCWVTNKNIISLYSPDKKYKLYEQKYWWGDDWNPMDYGRDFDFSRIFFDQFDEFLKLVPDMALIQDNNENSQYTNDCFQSKNCYYLFTSNTNQDCYYWDAIFWCKNCLEVLWWLNCENCFEIIKCTNCMWCFYGLNLTNCANCFYATNCESCTDCSFCVELKNQKYCILNKQYTKQDYEIIMNEIKNDLNKLEAIKLDYQNLIKKIPRKALSIISCDNVFWDQIESAKNCENCFDSYSIEDCKFLYSVWRVSDSYDCNITWTLDRINYKAYEWLSVPWINEWIFNISCWFWNNISYCRNCFYSSNLFGCVWLRNKEYCIFNKQYTKQEYEKLVPQIIEHMKKTWEWWEFFPTKISPFGYNETIANEYYPLDYEEAILRWYKREIKEYPINVPEWMSKLDSKDLPENLEELSKEEIEKILNSAIICKLSWKPYRIVKQELDFYRKYNLSIPIKHPDIRHMERIKKRAERKLYLRKCDCCGIEMISVYPQESDYKVYCEECYNKEIY